jgi:hypothetical protein
MKNNTKNVWKFANNVITFVLTNEPVKPKIEP